MVCVCVCVLVRLREWLILIVIKRSQCNRPVKCFGLFIRKGLAGIIIFFFFFLYCSVSDFYYLCCGESRSFRTLKAHRPLFFSYVTVFVSPIVLSCPIVHRYGSVSWSDGLRLIKSFLNHHCWSPLASFILFVGLRFIFQPQKKNGLACINIISHHSTSFRVSIKRHFQFK